jgi:hypothetical protein
VRTLDTNVLVHDDAAQGRRAQACPSAQPVYIRVTVILDMEWALRPRYGYSESFCKQDTVDDTNCD